MSFEELAQLFKKLLEARGHVKPMYNEYHVLKALLTIERKEPIGRIALSRELGIGVTSTRTLVKRLRELGIVEVDAVGGCFLTEHGRRILSFLHNLVKRIEHVTPYIGPDLALDREAYAALIAPPIAEKRSIVMLRDTFVRYGASAVLIACIRKGQAVLPPDFTANEYSLPSLRFIREALGGSEGDYIAVAYARNTRLAEEALYRGLVELLLEC